MTELYDMQTLVNGQESWFSPNGNAIWKKHNRLEWFHGKIKDVGSMKHDFHVPIEDKSQKCPYDVMSNWIFDKIDKTFLTVSCYKGTCNTKESISK